MNKIRCYHAHDSNHNQITINFTIAQSRKCTENDQSKFKSELIDYERQTTLQRTHYMFCLFTIIQYYISIITLKCSWKKYVFTSFSRDFRNTHTSWLWPRNTTNIIWWEKQRGRQSDYREHSRLSDGSKHGLGVTQIC